MRVPRSLLLSPLLGALIALPACSGPDRDDPNPQDPDARGPDDPDGGPIGPDGRPLDPDAMPPIDAAIDAPMIDDTCDPDPPIFPGADEVVDGIDNDCDGLVDELFVCATGGADFASIGEAITAAPVGGTIFLCGGTYNERLTINAKSVTLKGDSGAAATIIDGGAAGNTVVVTSTPGSGVTLDGVTIRNGRAMEGGGIYCVGSTLQLLNAVVTANTALQGAGVHATSCQLTVQNTTFSNNAGAAFGSANAGGGIRAMDSTGSITGSRFTGNTNVIGAGIAILKSAPTVTATIDLRDNEFTGNHAVLRGGGIYSDSNSTIENNRIVENDAGMTGGGLHIVAHAPLIKGNLVHKNSTGNDGGGIYLHQSDAHLLMNTFTENHTGDDGGGIRAFESTALIEANIVLRNTADDAGAGMRISHVPCELIDNIIRDNDAGGTGGGLDLDNDASLVRGGEITGNHAGGSGGGIFAWLAPWTGLRLENILIADNRAWRGGGLFVDDNFTPVTMKGLVVRDNFANRGGGLMIRGTNYTLKNSLFLNNEVNGRGGAIYAGVNSQTSAWPHPCPPCPPTNPIGNVLFTVFHGNEAPQGAAIWTDSPGLNVSNSIFSANEGMALTVMAPEPTEMNPMPSAVPPGWRYNNVTPATYEGMSDPTGSEGNLSVEPGYVDADGGDFHLAPGSPLVNAGDPALTDADGSRADLGMYGGTP